MRIRTIKPDFWTDEKVVELTPWARLLFIGLWNLSDDHGRLIYSPKKIKLQIFPADSLEVGDLFRELTDQGLVLIYKNGDATEYLQVKNFAEHQKIDKRSPSKFPEPHPTAPTPAELPQVPPDPAESPRIPPPEVEVERNGTEGKKPSPATASAEPNLSESDKSKTDPRYQALVDSFHRYYPVVNDGQKCPWSKREGNQAKLLLASLDPKTWTPGKLDRCVQFRLMSMNKPASEPPAAYLIHLPKYFEAPLDEYGKPDLRRAGAWLKKYGEDCQKHPESGRTEWGTCYGCYREQYSSKPPRVFEPDPALADLPDQLANPWIPILAELKGRINPHSFDTWLKPTRFAGVDGQTIVVQVPTPEFQHIGDKWGYVITETLDKLRMPFKAVEFWSP
jgi:hypothetical protein